MHVTRIPRISLAALFVLFGTTSACQAADDSAEAQHRLQYKFQMGEVLRYGVKHATKISTTIEATTQEAESQSESIKAWKVTDVLPNGEMEFVHVVEEVRMSNRVPNRAERKFDSEKDETPPPGFEQAASAIGIPLSVIRVSPAGKVTAREEKHPQPAPSKDLPITPQLPAEPVAVGEEWAFTYDVEASRKSGAKQSVRTRRICKLEQVKAGVATISIEYQILTPVSSAIESQLIDRLSKGKVRFDIERGRILSQKFDADRRVIGFSGDASSMHFISRMEERLLSDSATQHTAQREKLAN